MEHKKTVLTKGRLNKMLKYFKGKQVIMRYFINDEIAGSREEEIFKGVYDDFTVNSYNNGYVCFTLWKQQPCELVWIGEHGFYAYQCEFVGVGKIKESNGGPYCYFIVEKLGWWQRLLTTYFR